MKVLQINTIAGTGSTGRITEDILEIERQKSYDFLKKAMGIK